MLCYLEICSGLNDRQGSLVAWYQFPRLGYGVIPLYVALD